MRTIALTLPQYHAIPENDKWWGKGFTDWNNVKTAKPLYPGHYQPVIPMENNYYDMSKIQTLIDQAKLAKQYGIYGFCYYHYWFNGKLLLEKPCENLLNHPEIDTHYCFCWANESWARTWDGKDTEILIKQTFGGQDDWSKHIEYLIPFFKDERYIRNNNSPVIFIYSVERINDFNKMLSYWNECLKKNNIPPLYIVEFVNTFSTGKNNITSNAVCEFEPHATAKYSVSSVVKAKRFICKKLGLTDYLDYDYIWKHLLSNNKTYGPKKVIKCAFVGFDNSPRKKRKSMIIKGSTPDKFYKYLSELVKKTNRNYENDFLVINAWNEWAEGAILEPTKKYKYGYLKALLEATKDCSNR